MTGSSAVAKGADKKLTTISHFIDGQFVPGASNQTFESINPATGKAHALVALGEAEDIDRAVQAANRSFKKGEWSTMPIAKRCQVLRKIGDGILARQKELAIAESTDNGKPISESFEGDIPRSAQNFHFFGEFAASHVDEAFSVSDQERHIAVREPLVYAVLLLHGICRFIWLPGKSLQLLLWAIASCLSQQSGLLTVHFCWLKSPKKPGCLTESLI
jgi:hypothetical protein